MVVIIIPVIIAPAIIVGITAVLLADRFVRFLPDKSIKKEICQKTYLFIFYAQIMLSLKEPLLRTF